MFYCTKGGNPPPCMPLAVSFCFDNDECAVGSIERPFSDRSSPLPIPSYHVEILTTGRRTNRTSIGKIKFFNKFIF